MKHVELNYIHVFNIKTNHSEFIWPKDEPNFGQVKCELICLNFTWNNIININWVHPVQKLTEALKKKGKPIKKYFLSGNVSRKPISEDTFFLRKFRHSALHPKNCMPL